MFFIIILITRILSVFSNSGEGHLKPLGFQRKPEGHIEVTNVIPDAKTFFYNYVKGSKPIVFKGAAKSLPAFSKWSDDDFLKREFGHILVDIEEGKKENRSLGSWRWPFKEFLEKYQEEDIYLVQTLEQEMLKDLLLFPCLSCGGYSKVLKMFILWFSSGGTKSVLHNDAIDNINCLFSGTKELYMVDWKHRKFIDIDKPEGAFSNVNVDAVDLDKYPGYSKAPWWEAKMEAGDCLFIPYRWFHQVSSFTDNNRNMAVNIWFYHMQKINISECEANMSANTFLPLDGLEFGNKNIEVVRFILLLQLENNTEIELKKMLQYISKHHERGEISKADWKTIRDLMDKNGDKMISVNEIKNITTDELKVISVAFPGLYAENDDDDDDVTKDERDVNIKKDFINGKDEL